MVAVETFEAEYDARRRQVVSARNAADLAWIRYEGGLTSYLEVLETERQYFAAELDLSELTQQRLNSYVRLYKALGGGWMTPEERQSAK